MRGVEFEASVVSLILVCQSVKLLGCALLKFCVIALLHIVLLVLITNS